MQNRLFPIHAAFPQEMGIAGRILLDYGELEIDLMNCVSVIRKDLDAVLKTMFRTRGEKQRIEIADAMGRVPYRVIGLGTQFESAIADMQHCRKIRNQYAHAYWHNPGQNILCFVGLEDLARSHDLVTNLRDLSFFYTDLALLKLHAEFMTYTQKMFSFLNFQSRFLAGEFPSPLLSAPRQLERPALHIPPAKDRIP